MDERVFRTENRDDSSQEDVVARGHECWCDDQTRDLHEERCVVDGVESSRGRVPVLGNGGP